jgi:hypothetical protein
MPHAENLFAKGFVYGRSVGAIELITSFESYEHICRPMEETKYMLAISISMLSSTELMTRPAPKLSMGWYYGLDHGQHVSLYSLDTLKYMARSLDLKLCPFGLPACVRTAMIRKTKHDDHDLFKT